MTAAEARTLRTALAMMLARAGNAPAAVWALALADAEVARLDEVDRARRSEDNTERLGR